MKITIRESEITFSINELATRKVKSFGRFMMITPCLIFFLINVSALSGQTRNLHIEGSGDQYGVIQTTSTGNSKSGIEFLRGNAFNSTDWRIQNSGGQLNFEDGINNFGTLPDLNMSISTNGTINIFQGTDAEADDNSTGTLILGDPSSFHLALDDNGIIARNNQSGSRLLIQTGLDKGDTYLNNISGDVGIGTLVPDSKLGIEDNGFQIHLGNTQQFDNDWYIGASHEGWTVGGGKLVISPSTSSGNAMLLLDDDNSTISVRSNRITNAEDPVNDRDVVNLRSMNSAMENVSYLAPKEMEVVSTGTITFQDCANACRNTNINGHDDWTLPNMAQAVHFIEFDIGNNSRIWISDMELFIQEENFEFEVDELNLQMDLDDGSIHIDSRLIPGYAKCACVR